MNRTERIAIGLCSACHEPATEGRMCSKHAKKNREATQNIRARRKKSGQCVNCHRKARGKPFYGMYCKMHGLIHQAYISGYHEQRAAEWRAAGCCARCGVTCEGYHCPKHAEQEAKKQRDMYADKRAKGLCGRIGCYVVSGDACLCEHHRGKARAA